MTALDAYAKARIATIPENNRILITSHDAFNYFGRAYGLEVLGVQGLSTESEAGLQQINSLVDLLVERKIGAVFVESRAPFGSGTIREPFGISPGQYGSEQAGNSG